jgi:hypothetical protein
MCQGRVLRDVTDFDVADMTMHVGVSSVVTGLLPHSRPAQALTTLHPTAAAVWVALWLEGCIVVQITMLRHLVPTPWHPEQQ